MRKWTRSLGLIFCAASAVYNGPAAFAGEASQLNPGDAATSVKVIGDSDATAPSGNPSAPNSGLVSVSDKGTISVHTNKGHDIVDLLREIAGEEHISIVPSRGVQGTVQAMDLNDVSVDEALDAILHSNGMQWKRVGNLIYVFTDKELADEQKAARRMLTQTFVLHYIPAADALTLIKPALSADAVDASTKDAVSGIDSGDVSGDATSASSNAPATGGNSESGADVIVVKDYPENLQMVSKILDEVDRRPQQILVEATIFEATSSTSFMSWAGSSQSTESEAARAVSCAGVTLPRRTVPRRRLDSC